MKPKSLKKPPELDGLISFRPVDHLYPGHPQPDRGYQLAKIWSFDALGRKHNNGE